jgi:hypothetical protein|nr:MAG TPA: holin [Caudoviricetes sp.]
MTLLDVLKWIIENWQVIVAAAAACILAYSQIKKFMKLSDEQKKEKALELIRGAALSLMANAEAIFKGETGEIKKSECYHQICAEFPWIAELVSFEQFSQIIDDTMDKFNEYMDNPVAKANITGVLDLEDLRNGILSDIAPGLSINEKEDSGLITD